MNRRSNWFDDFNKSTLGKWFWNTLATLAYLGIATMFLYSCAHTHRVYKSSETGDIVQILDWLGRDVTGKVDPEKITSNGIDWVP